MTIDRRSLLVSAAGLLGASKLSAMGRSLGNLESASRSVRPSDAPLKILFLGGTGFIGPHMVREAMGRGHKVTLFSRGKHGTELFPEAERLIGDRNGQLDALKGKSWDVVIDNSGYTPENVKLSAELLASSVKHYFFTSTLDAYRDYKAVGIDESYPLAVLPAGAPHDPGKYYGPLKSMCEEEVARVFPNRYTVIRPGWIVGPGDNAHLFTYWVLRMNRGGEVLAPGTPNDPIQVIDARDLAKWVITMVETQKGGRYNTVGPEMSWAELLYGIKSTTSTPSTLVWGDADFLRTNKVRPFFGMPLWWPPRDDYNDGTMPSGLDGGVGSFRISGAKARAAGLVHRPLAELARDTFQWYQSEFKGEWPEGKRPGITPARETELIGLLKARR